jgi:hypothetical protein
MLLELKLHPGASMFMSSRTLGMDEVTATFAKAMPELSASTLEPFFLRMNEEARKLANLTPAGSC